MQPMLKYRSSSSLQISGKVLLPRQSQFLQTLQAKSSAGVNWCGSIKAPVSDANLQQVGISHENPAQVNTSCEVASLFLSCLFHVSEVLNLSNMLLFLAVDCITYLKNSNSFCLVYASTFITYCILLAVHSLFIHSH